MKAGEGAGWLSSGVPGDRHEGHDEGIDPEPDQPLGRLQDRRRRVAETSQDIGRDLAATEDRHGGRKSVPVALERHRGLAGHDAGADGGRHGLEMHPERVDAGGLHAVEPAVVVGRLALALDRQVDRGLDREGALAEHRGAAVGRRRRAGRHHHVLYAVEQHGGACHLGQLLGRLVGDRAAAASDWPMAQN